MSEESKGVGAEDSPTSVEVIEAQLKAHPDDLELREELAEALARPG